MCHHAQVHVTLSAEDKTSIKKLSGIMVPVYASIMLAIIAMVAITGTPRQGELIASTSVPAAAR